MWPPGPPVMFVGVCYDLNSHLTIVISTTNHRQASCEPTGRIMGPHIAVTIGFINQLIFIAAMGMIGLDAKAVGSHRSHRSQIIHGLTPWVMNFWSFHGHRRRNDLRCAFSSKNGEIVRNKKIGDVNANPHFGWETKGKEKPHILGFPVCRVRIKEGSWSGDWTYVMFIAFKPSRS